MSQSDEENRFYGIPESYVDDLESLEAFLARWEDLEGIPACSIDTEADSMHSYETKLCLIQFAIPGELMILDPLAVGEAGLRRFIEFVDRFEVVWMHGADYDISLFSETFDWVPATIWDTQVAARFLGKRKFGLANLLEDGYGVVVSKQSQKADWSKRPLSDKMLAYAYNDVRYLLDLGAKYIEQLREKGRLEWFYESCDAARNSVMNRTGKSKDDVWRITGWGKLSTKGLCFLRELWQWRDDECRRLDRPAFKFLGNAELLKMAIALEQGNKVKPPHYIRSGPVKRLHEVIRNASQIPSEDYPVKRKRGNGLRLDIDEAKFEKVRKIRNAVAEELEIESTLLATRSTLERLASRNLPEEEKLSSFLNWQRELLTDCFE